MTGCARCGSQLHTRCADLPGPGLVPLTPDPVVVHDYHAECEAAVKDRDVWRDGYNRVAERMSLAESENTRLRADVRRLRRALREIVRQDTPPKNAVPEVCWECGDQITEGENIDDAILCCYRCTAAQHATMAYTARAALAPRKGRKK